MKRSVRLVLCLVLIAPGVAMAERLTVSLEDIVLLSRSELSVETILVFLEARDIGFDLDAEAVVRLRNQGVSEEVIRYVLGRTEAGSRTVYEPALQASSPVYPLRYYSSGYLYPPRYYAGYYGFDAHWWHDYTHSHYYGHHYAHHYAHHDSHGGHSLSSGSHGIVSGRHGGAGHVSGGHGH